MVVEIEFYRGEPVGLPQESFGADVVDTCTQTALDHFFEATNAALGPILNIPGLTMLYADDAVMEVQMPGPAGALKTTCRGLDEIQSFFERLAKLMISTVFTETGHSIVGRTAIWRGRVEAVDCRSRKRLAFDALYRLEFDEFDLVTHESCRLVPLRNA